MYETVEFASFRLKDGFSVQDFLEASDKFSRDFISLRKGFVSRKLLRCGDMWSDFVVWETLTDAQSALNAMLFIWVTINDTSITARSMHGSASASEYLSFIDEGSSEILHYTVERNYLGR